MASPRPFKLKGLPIEKFPKGNVVAVQPKFYDSLSATTPLNGISKLATFEMGIVFATLGFDKKKQKTICSLTEDLRIHSSRIKPELPDDYRQRIQELLSRCEEASYLVLLEGKRPPVYVPNNDEKQSAPIIHQEGVFHIANLIAKEFAQIPMFVSYFSEKEGKTGEKKILIRPQSATIKVFRPKESSMVVIEASEEENSDATTAASSPSASQGQKNPTEGSH